MVHTVYATNTELWKNRKPAKDGHFQEWRQVRGTSALQLERVYGEAQIAMHYPHSVLIYPKSLEART